MSVWFDKRLKCWRYRFQHLGTTYTGSKFKTRREGESARSKRRKELREAAAQTVMVFSDLAHRYLDYAERRFATGTYKYKSFVFAQLIHHQGDLPITQITPDIIEQYLKTRKTNNNYNMHRKDLSALFNWAKRTLKLPIQNPCIDIDKMPHSPHRKEAPTEEEISRMILAAAPGDEQDILITCLHTLGRIDEVLRLRWEDVNFTNMTIALWTRKRKNGEYQQDVLPFSPALRDVLKVRYDKRTQNNWVFYNEETQDRFFHRPKMMRSICKRAGLSPIGKGRRKVEKGKHKGEMREFDLYYGFHNLRHFMATYLADQEKVGMKTVSGLLRHKNLQTTEIYLHPIDENQRTAINQMSPKFTSKNPFRHTESAHQNE